jgi:hypothetical protein
MSENERPPDWVEPVLAAGRSHGRFRDACRAAAGAAGAVHRLRLTSQRLGPHPLPVRSFLEGLADAAGVPLDVPLGWAGLQLDGPPDPSFAAAWGRLAAALRLGWPESRLQLHLSLLEASGSPVSLTPVRPRGVLPAPASLIAEGEEAVAAATADWDPARRAHLIACEEAARRAFLDSSA